MTAPQTPALPTMGELPPYIYGREAGPNEKVWTESAVRSLVAQDRAARAVPELPPEQFEIRTDGERVPTRRWEWGIRRIVALLWGNRHAFEVDEVVEAVRKLAPQRINEDGSDDEGLVASAERGFAAAPPAGALTVLQPSVAPAIVDAEAVAWQLRPNGSAAWQNCTSDEARRCETWNWAQVRALGVITHPAPASASERAALTANQAAEAPPVAVEAPKAVGTLRITQWPTGREWHFEPIEDLRVLPVGEHPVSIATPATSPLAGLEIDEKGKK